MKCRFCEAEVTRTFLDLGVQPLSNAYVRLEDKDGPETFYPLHVRVCDACLLVQLPECATPEAIFSDYAYLSSTSASWVAHAKAFAEGAIARLGLSRGSRVVEVASNDGYLLRHFQARGIPVLGVEPAANVADIARAAGVPTHTAFFGRALGSELATDGGHADLVVANNVLAHVPDLNDFVAGLAAVVAPTGVVSIEVPHLARLLAGCQFDTVYHEHFSYFSLATLTRVLAAHDLETFDVEELSTHGGSLRVFAQRKGGRFARTSRLGAALGAEERDGGCSLARYDQFSDEVSRLKRELLRFLVAEKDAGRRIAAYGAPAKGNTLLNFLGVRSDILDFTVDRNHLKQGTLLPGTRIPVHAPEELAARRPDVILVLPWNLETEICAQLAFVREWGARLVIPVPTVRVVS